MRTRLSFFRFSFVVLVLVLTTGWSSSAEINYGVRRSSAYSHIVNARSHYIEAEVLLSRMYEKGIESATEKELDSYQTEVALCLAHALAGYYLTGGKVRVPPSNCEVPGFLENLADEYLTELLFPDTLVELVRTGIIPDLPWRPFPAFIHNESVNQLPEDFQPFAIFYRPIVSQRGWMRNQGGYSEGAVLLVFGSNANSVVDPRFKQWIPESWLEQVLDSRVEGLVGYFVQIADE